MQPIYGIHHVAMKCVSEEQYQKTIAFYRDVLELPVVRTWAKGTMIDTGKGLLEIFNNGEEELPQGVIRHYAFAVTDTDACVRKVTEAGYTVFDGPRDIVIASDPPFPARVAFCHGPLGEEIEFFEEKEQTVGTAAQAGKPIAQAAAAAGASFASVTGTDRDKSSSSSGETAPGEDLLVISDLCKKYPEFQLDHASFSVRKGRIMGFIGRNGAGKTTTLKCALNLVTPDSGSIRFFGMDMPEHETAIKQRIGFASGGVDYYNKKKIADIVKVTSSFYDNWDEQAYREYMKMFSLDDRKTPAELSQGMKVKLNLALALSHKAELLLLDEPTSGLDPVSRDEILTIFEYLRSKGCAILFSTHVTSDLDKCADDITYIHDGKIIISTTKEQFISENSGHGSNVEEIMLYYEREKYGETFRI